MADEDNIPDGDGGKPQPVVMPPVDTNQRHFDAGGQPTPILPPEPEQNVPQPTVNQEQPPATPDYKLWENLNKTQLYTKPYSDFQKQFNNNQSVDRLYQHLNESQLYTKGKDDFYNQFFAHLPSQEVQNANKFLNDIVKTPQANAAIDKLTGDLAANQFYAQQANQSEGKDATRIQQPFIGRLPSTVEDDRKDFINQANNNPDMLRDVTKEIKRQNVDRTLGFRGEKDPDLNGQIDIANYTVDANKRPHSDAVVRHNINRLASRDLQYDEVNKQLVRPEGTLGSIFRAMQNHSDSLDEYDYLTTHNDDDVIKHLDDKNANYDPDKPVYKAVGTLPSVGEMVGSNLSAGFKLGAGSIAGKLAGAAAPELSLPIAAITTIGMGMGVTDFHHTQYANTLQQIYQETISKNPGIDKHIALQYAKSAANFSGALAMGQALLMGEVGNKLTNDVELNPVSLSTGKLKTVKDVLTNIVKQSKSIAPDALGQASIATGVKAVDNHFQGKPMADGGGDAFMGTLAMMGMLGLVKAPDAFLGGAGKRNVMDILSKAPEGTVDNLAAAHNALGTMTPENAAAAKNEVNIHKAQTEDMPDVTSPLTPEAEHVLKLADEGSKIFMNKDLEKVARENGITAEEGKELSSNTIIDQLRSKQKSVRQPPTFEEPSPETLQTQNEKNTEHIIQEPKQPVQQNGTTQEPAYLLSRHADTVKDEQGKVSGPNDHPLSTEGKKDKNSLANEVQEHAEKTGIPVTKIVHSSLERSKETADGVAEKTGAKTVSDKGLDTWDIGQFDDMKDEEFKKVQQYFVEHPDELKYDGKKLGETFNQYAHRTIDAHAKYENEPASTMLVDHSNNMMIMDAYRKNGGVWDDKASQDYLNAKKPEAATLVKHGESEQAKQTSEPEINKRAPDYEPARKAEIDEAVKPDIKLQKIKPTDLAKPDDAIELKSRHDEIWNRYKELKDIVNCVWS